MANFLTNKVEINLIIKPHPSKANKDFKKLSNVNYIYEKNCSTFQLVNISDIVISTITSALTDAFMLNKKIIILSFCSPFYLIPRTYNPEIIANNFEELRSLLSQYSNQKNTNSNYNTICSKIVYSNYENVLEVYGKKIIELSH